jgi:hypothetical protein
MHEVNWARRLEASLNGEIFAEGDSEHHVSTGFGRES